MRNYISVYIILITFGALCECGCEGGADGIFTYQSRLYREFESVDHISVNLDRGSIWVVPNTGNNVVVDCSVNSASRISTESAKKDAEKCVNFAFSLSLRGLRINNTCLGHGEPSVVLKIPRLSNIDIFTSSGAIVIGRTDRGTSSPIYPITVNLKTTFGGIDFIGQLNPGKQVFSASHKIYMNISNNQLITNVRCPRGEAIVNKKTNVKDKNDNSNYTQIDAYSEQSDVTIE
jgi:hypothetical protein